MKISQQCIKKIMIFILAVSIVGLFSVIVHADDPVKSINHRGYNKIAPENTLPAYELSKEKGYSYVEADISFTKDGVPVLLHDKTINRTARNGDGNKLKKSISINDLTYAEALVYDFGIKKGEEYKGTRIPTLEEFLDLCKELELHPYLDLKENGKYTQEQIEGLVDMVKSKGMDVTWISFSEEYLSWVRDKDPKARLGLLEWLLFSTDDYKRTMRTAKSLQTGSNEVFLDVNYIPLGYDEAGTDLFISMCEEDGIPLEVWTVDKKGIMEELDPYISGVTTNKLIYEEVMSEESLKP